MAPKEVKKIADKLTDSEKKKIKQENKAKANPAQAAAKKEKSDAKRERRKERTAQEPQTIDPSQSLLFLLAPLVKQSKRKRACRLAAAPRAGERQQQVFLVESYCRALSLRWLQSTWSKQPGRQGQAWQDKDVQGSG